MNGASETPIEDYLDELLRRTHAGARATRRLLDEANGRSANSPAVSGGARSGRWFSK